ncbi:hypothetical protein, partial [Acinetobacter baumannii]|uniref:hypothetical protein n=1 Tax=Acinetobacter baumannii TaxID=470 RepID=UPI00197AE2CC
KISLRKCSLTLWRSRFWRAATLYETPAPRAKDGTSQRFPWESEPNVNGKSRWTSDGTSRVQLRVKLEKKNTVLVISKEENVRACRLFAVI